MVCFKFKEFKLVRLFLLIAQQQQQWTPTLTATVSMNSNMGSSQIQQNNQQQSIDLFYPFDVFKCFFVDF